MGGEESAPLNIQKMELCSLKKGVLENSRVVFTSPHSTPQHTKPYHTNPHHTGPHTTSNHIVCPHAFNSSMSMN